MSYLIVAGFLAVCLSVFFVYGIIEIGRLKDKIKSLDSAIVKYRDDCETRIALIKAGKSGGEDLDNGHARPPEDKRAQFRLNLPQAPKMVTDDMKKSLALSDEQAAGISAVLKDYQKDKALIFRKVSQGGGFQFGSFEYLKELSAASEDVNRKLQNILSDQQCRIFREKNYDLHLGIRIPKENLTSKDNRGTIRQEEDLR